MSLPICNRFQAKRANSGKITTCKILKNVRSMLKKCHAQNVQVYLQPFRRNSVLECAQHLNIAKNSLDTPFEKVQGHSR